MMAPTSRGAETAEEDCLRAGDEVQAKNEEEQELKKILQKYRIKEIELVALRLSVGGFTTADDLDFLEAENVEKLDVLERDKNALKRMIRELNNTNEGAAGSVDAAATHSGAAAGAVPASVGAAVTHRGAEGGAVPGAVRAFATLPEADAGFTKLEDVARLLERMDKKIEEGQKNIRTALHVVTESIRYVHESLTPTEARTAKSFQYKQLLEKMQLKVRTLRADEVSSLGEPPNEWQRPFAFVWPKEVDSVEEAAEATGTEGSSAERVASPPLPDSASDDGTSTSKNKDPLEKECYGPVKTYVTNVFPDLDVHIAAEGQELDHGLLFSEKAFTSRKLKPDTHGQQVIHIMNIHGRTDIVAFDGRGRQRSNVKFAIEMKRPNAMNNAEREAITQLLGLNISNAYNSPPVVLSNAVQTHCVFFVEQLDAFPFFGIVQGNFRSLCHALWLVHFLISKPGCTMHLGRGPTPPSSSQEF